MKALPILIIVQTVSRGEKKKMNGLRRLFCVDLCLPQRNKKKKKLCFVEIFKGTENYIKPNATTRYCYYRGYYCNNILFVQICFMGLVFISISKDNVHENVSLSILVKESDADKAVRLSTGQWGWVREGGRRGVWGGGGRGGWGGLDR